MAEVLTALAHHLDAADEASAQALASSLEGIDLPAARLAAKEDPASDEAVAQVLGRLIVDEAETADLVDAAKAAAQRAPRDASGNAVALLAGNVIWKRTGQPQNAEPYFRRVRRTDPASDQVLGFYRAMFAGGQASQLMQVLVQARRASKEDPERRFSLAEEMATLAEEQLSSPERAIEVWRSVMREDGYDERASRALERLYRDAGKWTALVDLLKDELERIGQDEANAEARIAKLLEIAGLYRDRLKLDTMALATLQRILDIDPRHEASLEALAETYAKAGRFNDLLGVYARRVEAAAEAGDTERQVELLRKVAAIWVDELGNPQRALEPLSQVLALAPGDAAARKLLATIHEKRRDWRALIALRREELAEREGDEALALRVELARLAEDKLGDRREAIQAWNEVLDHHGEHVDALDALGRLYERENRWASAAEILHRKLATASREDAAILLGHLGGIYSDRLASAEDALRVWGELLRLVPGHDRATRRLRDLMVAAGRWDDLTALYESQGRLADVVDVLQGAADRQPDTEARVALYRRVASLCRERLGQPERAQKALERTLAIQPDNLDVARELLPIYREQKNWARLMSTYEVLLEASGEDDERLSLIASMQEVAEQELASPTLTLQWAARAYQIRPADTSLREGLEIAAERADGWDELVAIFEARIADGSVSDEERLVLLDKLAVIAHDRLFKPDDAQRHYRRIIALNPSDEGAMNALENIYSSTRRWDDLSEVYRKRLEITDDPAARRSTLRGLAKLQEEQLGDLDAAIGSLEGVLELSPEDASTLDALSRIHRNRGNWPELADILARKLELAESPTARVPVMFELAQVRATRLSDSEPAVEGFLAVLEIEPMHREAVAALEQLRQSDPSVGLAVMKGLLPFYRRVDDRVREAEALEVIVAAEEDAAARRELHTQLAAIYEQMEDRREDALRIRGELFLADPADYDGRKTLQRLGAELGHTESVAGAYEAALRELGTEADQAEAEGRTLSRDRATLRRDMLLEHAAQLRDALARPEDAEVAYREVLETDETHQGAYEALEALLQGRGGHSELRDLYRRRADVTFNQKEQRALLSRIIELSRNVLADRPTAVATAEELLDLIPDDLDTIRLLARMYAEGSEQSDHENLEEILGRWAEMEPDDALRRNLMVRRGELRMQYLGDAFGAVDLLGQVLGEDPTEERARGLLEELLDIAEVQLQACALLEPIYGERGDHHGRIRILRVRRAQAESGGSVDEAVTHLLEIARVHEQELGDASAAFDAMREAYLMDPRRLDTREQVHRLGLSLSRPAELVDVWRAALSSDVAVDPALRIDLTHRVAVLVDEQLGDQDAAREAYAELLALDPPDASLAHKAVESLCRLHLEAGDGVALVEAKRALLRFTDAQSDQVRIRLEIADIQEQLGDRVGGAITYSEVLDMEPDNMGALEALERLFLEEEEWERLCEVLAHRIDVTADPRGRAPVWRQIGEIRRDQMSDAPGAVSAFQSVLDLKVGREETAYALQALVGLHEQLEQWADVEESLRRLVALADNDGDRVELQLMTAHVVGERLNRASDALDLLKRVLDLEPADTRARESVTRYLDDDDLYERALRILMPIYEAEENWPRLLELEELQARHQPSGRRRLQALLKVASTAEEKIGDPDRAFAVLCEAMAEAADQPELAEILEKVERLGEEDHRAQALGAAYAKTVDHILDAALQKRVLRSMGQVALERTGDHDEAQRAFERVHEMAPDDAEAIDALERIYLARDQHEALAGLLVHRADRVDDDGDRDEILIRAAEIHRVQLGDAEASIRLYERLSSDGLARPEVQEVIEPLYAQTDRHRELAAHLNRKLAALQGRDLVDVHLRLGRLYGEKLGDPEEGIRHMSTALRLDPDHAVATEELGRYLEDESMRQQVAEMLEPVFAAVGEWSRLIQIQEIRLADAPDETTRVQILMRIAQIEEDQLEDLDKAFESYQRVFREQPTNQVVRDQLSRLAGVLARLDDFAELLTAHVTGEGQDDDTDEMLAVVREAADLWSGSLRQPARAVPLLQRIRDARPDDRSVFMALESALTQAEMWRDLATAYWSEADHSADETRQVEVLRKVATLAQEMLEDPQEAGRAYQRILEIRPDNELARSRLEHIYEETERWPELVDLLRDRLSMTESTEAGNGVSARIADILAERLEDADGAVDTLEGMLAELEDDPDAVIRLERVAQGHVPLRPRVLAILRPIYERQGNVRRLVEVDEWQLNHTDDPAARQGLYREMSLLLQQTTEGTEAAFRTLCRAMAEPGPEEALAELDTEARRLATALELHAELAEAMVAAAQGEPLVDDVERRLALLVGAATIRHARAEVDDAVAILRAALELSEEHEPALELLDMALTQRGDHEGLRDVLAARARIATDDDQRLGLQRRLAVLLDDTLVDRQAAEQAWKDLLDLEPTDAEALERLSRNYEATGQHEALVEILERRVEADNDEARRRDLRLALAQIQREALGDRSAEIDVLRAQLTEGAEDDEVFALLAQALVAEERHAEAVDVLSERATIAPDDASRAELVLDSARLLATALGDLPGALERYERVLQLAPSHEGAVSDLVALATDGDIFEAAGNLVAPQLEAAARWDDLARVLSARAERTEDPEDKAGALHRLAQVRLERLSDAHGALAALTTMLDVVETEHLEAVLTEAGRIAVTLGNAGDFVELLAQHAADDDREPAARVAMASYAAHLAEEVMGEAERALGLLVPLLDAGLGTMELCERVERLGRAGSVPTAVEQALREAARLADDPSTQAAALVRLGDVQVELGELEGALESYREAFELSGDPAAVRGLENVLTRTEGEPSAGLLDALDAAYQATSDRGGQARVVQRRLATAHEADQGRLWEQLAVLRDEGGGSPDEALEAWGSLLSHDPDSAQALERTLTLGRETGRLAAAVESLLTAVAAAADQGRPATPLALQAGAVLLNELSQPQRAMEVLEGVLSESPDNAEALELHVQAARGTGDPNIYHAALVQAAQAQPDPHQAARLWHEAATVAEGTLTDTEAAIADLEQVLAADEQHGEAWNKLLVLLAQTEKWEPLADAIGRRVMLTDDGDERQELRARLAQVYVDRLEREQDAMAVYQDMIADRPDDTQALADLERVQRRLEQWDDVRETLERRLEIADGDDRTATLLELARLAENKLEDRLDASERYQEILVERPGHPEAEASLERLLRADERWVDLSELLEARMNRQRDAGDADGFRQTASELAALLAEKLEDAERAESILRQLLELDPGYVPALLSLAAVHETRGDEASMREALEQAAAGNPQGEQGAALQLRLAKLAGDDAGAKRQHLTQALELYPHCAPAIEALLTMSRDDEKWGDVVSLLELAADAETDPERKRDLTLERVDLGLTHVGDPDRALEVLMPLYESVQDDVQINRRIADALFAADRFDDASQMYEWLVEVTRRGKRSKVLAHYLTRLARISVMAEQGDAAREQLLEAYRVDTTNVETLMSLGSLHEGRAEWKDALKIYRTMLLQNADQSGLLRRGDIYVSLARAHLALEEKPKARAMLRRGLEEDAGHPELQSQLTALE